MYESGAVEKIMEKMNTKFSSLDEFLHELREVARENYIPVMRKETTSLLKSYIEKCQPKQILEIGTSLGVSGMTALSASKGARLTTIDIDEVVTYGAKKFFSQFKLDTRCEFILGDANKVIAMMDKNQYDFIILDGPKGQYLELYKMLLPMLDVGGIMFVDDINYFNLINKDGFVERKHRTIVNAMRQFLDTINNDTNVKVTLFNIDDGVLVAERV